MISIPSRYHPIIVHYLYQDDKRVEQDLDIHVLPVWNQGITGKGVVVTILDDGKLSVRAKTQIGLRLRVSSQDQLRLKTSNTRNYPQISLSKIWLFQKMLEERKAQLNANEKLSV